MRQTGLYLTIVFGSLALSISLQLVLPFPYGLVTAILILIVLPQIIKWRMMKKLKGLGFSTEGPRKLEKTCMKCGWKTNKAICPRCESKLFSYK